MLIVPVRDDSVRFDIVMYDSGHFDGPKSAPLYFNQSPVKRLISLLSGVSVTIAFLRFDV